MSSKTDEKGKPASEEPFLLSMLPFAGLVLILVVALLWRSHPFAGSAEKTKTDEREKLVVDRWERASSETIPVAETDFTMGPEDAPVTIVEYSDFQCPFCRAGAEAVRDTFARFPDDVRLVFKNFPLDKACNDEMTQQLHPLACRAAAVALCAGEEDSHRFWKAHDAMFASPQLSEKFLEGLPTELGLAPDSVAACLAAPATMEKIKADIAEARSLGVSSTPTLFVNGRRLSDYRDGLLSRLVEHVLSRAERP
jgi:protein-disulfide isomerase